MKLTMGLAQISPRLGDMKANLDKHLEFVERAAGQGVQLLVFPELSLTGYMLQYLVHEVACLPDDPLFVPLLDASHKLDLVFGFAERDVRGRLFTAGVYLAQGRIVHVHRKVYLPTYGMFDEGRDFDWGEEVRAFDTRFGRAGLLICEDFWHASPPYLLWLDGADLLLLTSASPGRGMDHRGKLGSSRFVELVNQAYANLFGCYIVHVNRVGFEDGVNFWGGSTVFGPDGELIAQAAYFEESLLAVTLDLSALRRARARLPLLRDERPELTQRELERILSKT
jgi:NAD+ synthase (glutamine-hydrolysing)